MSNLDMIDSADKQALMVLINKYGITQIKKVAEWEALKKKARWDMKDVDVLPYSHNILGMRMSGMSDEDAKKFATELQLGKLGWTHLDTNGEISKEDKEANDAVFECRRIQLEMIKNYEEGEEEEGEEEESDDDRDEELEDEIWMSLNE